MKIKTIKKSYKFRIYPTLEQKKIFAKFFGCVRKVHNLMLDDRKKGYEEYKSTGIKNKIFVIGFLYRIIFLIFHLILLIILHSLSYLKEQTCFSYMILHQAGQKD